MKTLKKQFKLSVQTISAFIWMLKYITERFTNASVQRNVYKYPKKNRIKYLIKMGNSIVKILYGSGFREVFRFVAELTVNGFNCGHVYSNVVHGISHGSETSSLAFANRILWKPANYSDKHKRGNWGVWLQPWLSMASSELEFVICDYLRYKKEGNRFLINVMRNILAHCSSESRYSIVMSEVLKGIPKWMRKMKSLPAWAHQVGQGVTQYDYLDHGNRVLNAISAGALYCTSNTKIGEKIAINLYRKPRAFFQYRKMLKARGVDLFLGYSGYHSSVDSIIRYIEDGINLYDRYNMREDMKQIRSNMTIKDMITKSFNNHCVQAALKVEANKELVGRIMPARYWLPEGIRPFFMTRGGELIQAGDELKHCLGSYANTKEEHHLFFRKGNVCVQVDMEKRKVLQCYDYNNTITGASRAFGQMIDDNIYHIRPLAGYVPGPDVKGETSDHFGGPPVPLGL